jgi:hypothetical protein
MYFLFLAFIDIPQVLFGHFAKSDHKRQKGYPPQLRELVLTLNFLPTKAYEYVRQTFGKILPHRSRYYF